MPSDDDIWKAYTKGVKRLPLAHPPLRGGSRRPLAARGGVKTDEDTPPRIFSALRAEKIRVLPQGKGALTSKAVFDRATERRYRSGDITIDARIDLHGMTQAEAHAALEKFIAAQVKVGAKNLLVITGKGKGNQGVLRVNLPNWLANLPETASILGLRPAAPRHGGNGAFYAILKRKKDRAE